MPNAMVSLLNEDPPDALVSSPNHEWLAVMRRRKHLTLAEVRRPLLQLFGAELNPVNHAPRRSRLIRQVTLMNVASGTKRPIRFPRGSEILPVGFSPDGGRFAAGLVQSMRTSLFWCACESGEPELVQGVSLNATALTVGQPPAFWISPTQLLCRAPVDGRRGTRQAPAHPRVYETSMGDCPVEWLKYVFETSDLDLLEKCLCSQLAIVDTSDGTVEKVGEPGVFERLSVSPDGQYILLERLERMPDRTSVQGGVRVIEVVERKTGAVGKRFWRANAERQVGRASVPAIFRWNPFKAATIVSADSSAGRARVTSLAAPFDAESDLLFSTRRTVDSVSWTRYGSVVIRETDTRSGGRWLHVHSGCGRGTDGTWLRMELPTVEPSVQSSMHLLPAWIGVEKDIPAAQADNRVFLVGKTRQEGRIAHFLDSLDIVSGKRTRTFASADDVCEEVIGIVNSAGTRLLTVRESPTCRPVHCMVHLTDGRRSLVAGRVPRASYLASVRRRRVEYIGHDGRPVAATVYLPPASVKERPVRMVLWLYPQEGRRQDRVETFALNAYARSRGLSPLFLLGYGYGVVDLPPLRISTRADAVEELRRQAESLVAALVSRRYAAEGRLVVGGHCVGGYAASVLLAQTDLFCAGIACSAQFNSTVHPRESVMTTGSLWKEPESYIASSPFFFAERIKRPILIVHGEREDLPVDPRSQSRPFFAALAATGGRARYVSLPHEGHYYEARESLAAVSSEILAWCDVHTGRESG